MNQIKTKITFFELRFLNYIQIGKIDIANKEKCSKRESKYEQRI